jgi:MFS family permease
MPQESFETPSSSPSSPGNPDIRSGIISRLVGPFAGDTDFLKCWFGQGASYLGTQISLIAVPIIAAVTLDASPLELGLLYACGQLPALLFGLFAGAWLDGRRRRPVMIATDIARTILTLVVPLAALLGWLSIPMLCIVLFGLGTLTIFFDIAHLSYVPTLVDRSQLVAANSRLEATASGAQVVGPAVGGALIGLLTGPGALLIDAVSYVISAIALRSVRKPETQPVHIEQGEPMRKRIASGLRFVASQPALRALAGCSAVTNLFGYAFLSVYVAFMIRELGLTDFQIGLVFATGGVGALLGSVLAGRCADWLGTGRTLIVAQLGFGITGLLVPLAVLLPGAALPLVVAAEFLQWMTLLVYSVNAISLRQRVTSDELQGRLHANFAVLTRGFQPVGSMLGGVVASVIGLSLTLVVSEIGLMFGVLFLIASPLRHNAGVSTVASVSPVEATT